MPFRYRVQILMLAASMVFAGCEHADPLEEDQVATLTSIQTSIFDTNCALSGCHIGDTANLPGSLDLRSGQSYANLVGVKSVERPALSRVTAGNPDDSYLIRKLEGGPDISGGRMPFGRSPLPQEQIDLIREWIMNGAEEN